MPAYVITTGDALPKRGKFGDMYFNVATSETYVWASKEWVLAVGPHETGLLTRSADPVAAAAEQRAEEYRASDANSRHGRVICAAVFQDQLSSHLRRVFTRMAQASVEFHDGTPGVVEGADHFLVHLGGNPTTLRPSAISFPLRYSVLRCLLLPNDDGEHLSLQDVSWRLVSALVDGGPERVSTLLDYWHRYWLRNDVEKRAQTQAAEDEAREIFLRAISGGGVGHGQLPGDAVP